jgi:hypothetical protein
LPEEACGVQLKRAAKEELEREIRTLEELKDKL